MSLSGMMDIARVGIAPLLGLTPLGLLISTMFLYWGMRRLRQTLPESLGPL